MQITNQTEKIVFAKSNNVCIAITNESNPRTRCS